jgi:hypothetical protein
MKYDVVQQSLEEYVKASWTLTEVEYDNVAFNSDLFDEYLRCNVVFNEGEARTITVGCYRQFGLVMLSIFTRPGTGTARQTQLATLAADMVKKVVVAPVAPLVAPKVKLQVPSMYRNNREGLGWVMAQVSCPFYYDF